MTPRPHAPRSLPARHPPNGAWPAEMRADMAAALIRNEHGGGGGGGGVYLDGRKVAEIILERMRREAK